MMLGLGLMLVFAPQWLTEARSAIGVLALALVAAVLTARLTPAAAHLRE